MLHSDIIRIAVRNGWKVSITASAEDSYYFDFQRRTPSGLPFCFTAELSGGHVGTLVDEIISFVDALDPGRYAVEWLEAAGPVTPSRYFQVVADMDDMRIHAWLLAFDLLAEAGKERILLDLPRYRLN